MILQEEFDFDNTSYCHKCFFTVSTIPFLGTLVLNCFVLMLVTSSTAEFLIYFVSWFPFLKIHQKLVFITLFYYFFFCSINIKGNSFFYIYDVRTQYMDIRIMRYTLSIKFWDYYTSISFHWVSDNDKGHVYWGL